jgi:periplasmic protein CpxP/Spy
MIPRRPSSIPYIAALAFVGLAAASAVVAQPAYSPPSQGSYNNQRPPDYRPPDYRPDGQSGGPDLAGLHAALNLSPSQETAWQIFAAASTPSADQEARQRAAQSMMATLHSPQRVDLSISAAEADLQTLRERGAALKAFYADLTPSQQAIFDRRTLPDEAR